MITRTIRARALASVTTLCVWATHFAVVASFFLSTQEYKCEKITLSFSPPQGLPKKILLCKRGSSHEQEREGARGTIRRGKARATPARFRFPSRQALRAYSSPLPVFPACGKMKEASVEERDAEYECWDVTLKRTIIPSRKRRNAPGRFILRKVGYAPVSCATWLERKLNLIRVKAWFVGWSEGLVCGYFGKRLNKTLEKRLKMKILP